MGLSTSNDARKFKLAYEHISRAINKITHDDSYKNRLFTRKQTIPIKNELEMNGNNKGIATKNADIYYENVAF